MATIRTQERLNRLLAIYLQATTSLAENNEYARLMVLRDVLTSALPCATASIVFYCFYAQYNSCVKHCTISKHGKPKWITQRSRTATRTIVVITFIGWAAQVVM